MFMVVVAALGAAFVLLDPKWSTEIAGMKVSFGGSFSADLKGAVITAILIGGWTAVKEYWLGASAGSQVQVVQSSLQQPQQPSSGSK